MTEPADPNRSSDPLAAQAQALLEDVDPERRESGLWLDRHGRWHHGGIPVTHERLHRALTRWLTRRPGQARHIIRVSDDFWAWVDVEDAPYQAHLREVRSDGLHLELSDEREVTWRGETIAVGADDAWYVTLEPRPDEAPPEARLARGAMATLAEYLEETDEANASDETDEAGEAPEAPEARAGATGPAPDAAESAAAPIEGVQIRLPGGRRISFTSRAARPAR
jgi:hypothetical protein